MFQDTLLIIKCDYMAKRKAVLLYVLRSGFFIKGQRKVCFSPELAAEFYQDMAEDSCFMFQVILLSKGNAEAFILTKENAVEDLLNAMVCYFGTSIEMERNVHVTKCLAKVQREISFIFPNYIYEPIYCPIQLNFCLNNPLVESTIGKLYDIITTPSDDPHKSWKEKLAEFLMLSNKDLPHISNQCNYNTSLRAQETSQQTKITSIAATKKTGEKPTFSDLDFDTDGTSVNITTSSCISCSAFGSAAECIHQDLHHPPYEDIIKLRTAPLEVKKSSSSDKPVLAEEEASGKWKVEEFLDEEEDIIPFERDGDKVDKLSSPLAKDLDEMEQPDIEPKFEEPPPAEPVQEDIIETPLEDKEIVTKDESDVKGEVDVKDESMVKDESVAQEVPAKEEEPAPE
ncbi:hypothetical protein DOY81_006658 [Sarcophaga bullata]|nr:hypothetical protein DOY81_006658 [Sarcophaga bullata]